MSNLTSVNANMEEEKNKIYGRWGSRAGSLTTQSKNTFADIG